jgi:hypothetical protein
MSVERLPDFALDAGRPLGREFVALGLGGYRDAAGHVRSLSYAHTVRGGRGILECAFTSPALPRTSTSCRSAAVFGSIAEGLQFEPKKVLGVGYQVDTDDLPALDRKVEDATRPPTAGPHGPRGPVDERRSRRPCTPREGAGHGTRVSDLLRCARTHGGAVGPEHDVRVEQRQKRPKVALARGGEEGPDDLPFAGARCGGRRSP